MKVLVTGGAGFIGSTICESLLNEGHSVISIDNFSPHYDEAIKNQNINGALKCKNFQFFRQDITDAQGLDHIFSKESPETVIHLAAEVGSRKSLKNPYPYFHTNITGTQRIIDACIRTSVKHLVLASSGSVYQGPSDTPFHEERTPARPFTPYSMTKSINEMMCRTISTTHQIHITVLRIFTTYGPRQRPDMAIHKFFRLAHRNQPLPVLNNALAQRDLIYISDCVHGILQCLENPESFRLLNIGTGRAITLTHLLRTIEKLTGEKITTLNIKDSPEDWTGGAADITAAKQLIRFNRKIDFEEGMSLFYQWFLETIRRNNHV